MKHLMSLGPILFKYKTYKFEIRLVSVYDFCENRARFQNIILSKHVLVISPIIIIADNK